MDYCVLKEGIDAYISELKNSAPYQRLLQVYNLILTKYSSEVEAFNRAKAKLEEALEYGPYYPGLKELKLKYQEAKINLYKHSELNEYFILIKELEDEANLTLTEIKNEII